MRYVKRLTKWLQELSRLLRSVEKAVIRVSALLITLLAFYHVVVTHLLGQPMIDPGTFIV